MNEKETNVWLTEEPINVTFFMSEKGLKVFLKNWTEID